MAERMVDINLHGVIFGSKLALERFLHARHAATWSTSPRSAGKTGVPGGATYCATKHAVVGLSEAIRGEFSRQRDRRQRRHAGRRQHRAVLGAAGAARLQDRRARGRRQRDRRGAADRALRGLRAEVAGADGRASSRCCQRAAGRRSSRALHGSDHVLLSADHGARDAYEQRMVTAAAEARPSRRPGSRLSGQDRRRAVRAGEPEHGRLAERSQSAIRAADLRARVLLEEMAGVGDHVRDLGARARRRTAARSRAAAPGLSRPT